MLPMALLLGAVSVVTLHAGRLQARWRATNALSSHGRGAFMAELSTEVERARRYGRHVSAALVSLPSDQGAGLVHLASRVRSTDRLFTDTGGRVLVVLPETDGPEADRFLARAVHAELHVQAVRATFPIEAHTAEGLTSVLFEKLLAPERSRTSEV
jgi:hypothetical protein